MTDLNGPEWLSSNDLKEKNGFEDRKFMEGTMKHITEAETLEEIRKLRNMSKEEYEKYKKEKQQKNNDLEPTKKIPTKTIYTETEES